MTHKIRISNYNNYDDDNDDNLILSEAASDCNSDTGLNLNYNLTLLNTKTYWLRHFSADEYGNCSFKRFVATYQAIHLSFLLSTLAVFPQNTVSLFLYCLILIVIAFQSVQLLERRLLHNTYKLFIACVLLEFLGLLLMFFFYLKYARQGESSGLLRMFGMCFVVFDLPTQTSHVNLCSTAQTTSQCLHRIQLNVFYAVADFDCQRIHRDTRSPEIIDFGENINVYVTLHNDLCFHLFLRTIRKQHFENH